MKIYRDSRSEVLIALDTDCEACISLKLERFLLISFSRQKLGRKLSRNVSSFS